VGLFGSIGRGFGHIGKGVAKIVGSIPKPIRAVGGAALAVGSFLIPGGAVARGAALVARPLVGVAGRVGGSVARFFSTSFGRKAAVAGALGGAAVVGGPYIADQAGKTLNRGVSSALGVSPIVLLLIIVAAYVALSRLG
jgi:hypothetical protein